MSTTLPVEGACMCGQVELRVSAPPIMTMACHCTGCQKLSASAFPLSAIFPAEAFEITAGTTQIGALHGEDAYHYCSNCLNWIYTAFKTMPFVNVRPAMFGVPAWSKPFVESCVAEKLSWASTPARHSFEKFPPPDSFGPLMAEYAATQGGV